MRTSVLADNLLNTQTSRCSLVHNWAFLARDPRCLVDFADFELVRDQMSCFPIILSVTGPHRTPEETTSNLWQFINVIFNRAAAPGCSIWASTKKEDASSGPGWTPLWSGTSSGPLQEGRVVSSWIGETALVRPWPVGDPALITCVGSEAQMVSRRPKRPGSPPSGFVLMDSQGL